MYSRSMVRAMLPAVLIACGDAGCSPSPDIELRVYNPITITPQGPTSGRLVEHRVYVDLSPCPSEPVEVAGSIGDAPLTPSPFGNCSAFANWPDVPVTTVKVTSSLGDVTATFAEGVFTPVVLTPTTQDGIRCGEPYAVTWDPPEDVQVAGRIAVIQWFLDLPPGCECSGAFEAVAPAVNPITFAARSGQVSTSLGTGTLTIQLSDSTIQGSAMSCEGARACTYQVWRAGVLRTPYRCP